MFLQAPSPAVSYSRYMFHVSYMPLHAVTCCDFWHKPCPMNSSYIDPPQNFLNSKLYVCTSDQKVSGHWASVCVCVCVSTVCVCVCVSTVCVCVCVLTRKERGYETGMCCSPCHRLIIFIVSFKMSGVRRWGARGWEGWLLSTPPPQRKMLPGATASACKERERERARGKCRGIVPGREYLPFYQNWFIRELIALMGPGETFQGVRGLLTPEQKFSKCSIYSPPPPRVLHPLWIGQQAKKIALV